MAGISSTSSVSTVTINGVNVIATVWNVSIPTANTEVAFALPAKTLEFFMRPRTPCQIQLAYAAGQSGTTYVTIPPRTNWKEDKFYTAQTIYFQTDLAGVTLEIVTYNI